MVQRYACSAANRLQQVAAGCSVLQQCGSALHVTAAGSNASGAFWLIHCNAFRCNNAFSCNNAFRCNAVRCNAVRSNCRTADLCTAAGRSGALQHAVLCAASCTM